jgi:hypothetical protein
MELTWLIRLRIAIAAAIGVGFIGIYGWPMVAPAGELGVVSIVNGRIAASDLFITCLMAFTGGFISYFLTWPYGTRIGILAAPAGLIAWAVRGGDMGSLMQQNISLARREEFYSTFCWEPVVWLAVFFAGCLGVLLGYSIYRPKKVAQEKRVQSVVKPTTISYLTPVVGVIGSTIVSLFLIGMIARDFIILDPKAGYAIGQPTTAQIIFAILIAFGVSGYLAKKVLDLNYYWPIIATGLVIPFGIIVYGQYDVLEYFAGRWPAVFFANSVLTVFPIQAVAFGSIGAVAGYWIAVRYENSQKTDTTSAIIENLRYV